MMEPRRLLTLAAALNLIVCVGAATAQTVIVRNAPPDTPVEVVLNDEAVGSGKTNEKGDALVTFGLSERLMKTETDAQVFVDVCPRRPAGPHRRALRSSAAAGRRLHPARHGGHFRRQAGELARHRRRRREPDLDAPAGEGEPRPAPRLEARANGPRVVRRRRVQQVRGRDHGRVRRRVDLFGRSVRSRLHVRRRLLGPAIPRRRRDLHQAARRDSDRHHQHRDVQQRVRARRSSRLSERQASRSGPCDRTGRSGRATISRSFGPTRR